jgi:hypothetical protein
MKYFELSNYKTTLFIAKQYFWKIINRQVKYCITDQEYIFIIMTMFVKNSKLRDEAKLGFLWQS